MKVETENNKQSNQKKQIIHSTQKSINNQKRQQINQNTANKKNNKRQSIPPNQLLMINQSEIKDHNEGRIEEEIEEHSAKQHNLDTINVKANYVVAQTTEGEYLQEAEGDQLLDTFTLEGTGKQTTNKGCLEVPQIQMKCPVIYSSNWQQINNNSLTKSIMSLAQKIINQEKNVMCNLYWSTPIISHEPNKKNSRSTEN
ncbi:hypothetical protein ABPG74_013576 [Tetrahymena malaccensis]